MAFLGGLPVVEVIPDFLPVDCHVIRGGNAEANPARPYVDNANQYRPPPDFDHQLLLLLPGQDQHSRLLSWLRAIRELLPSQFHRVLG
jgi:hypothetical protein